MTIALFIWGIIQSVLVGIVIPLVKKGYGNYLLSFIFFVISTNITFQYVLRFTEVKFNTPQLLVVPDILDLLLPTLLYIYLKKIFNKNLTIDYRILFAPCLIWSLLLLGFVCFKNDLDFHDYIGTRLHKGSLIVVFGWKLILLLKILPDFRLAKTSFKNKYRKLLTWPKTLIIFLAVITYISFFNLLFSILSEVLITTKSSLMMIRPITHLNYIIFTCFILFISIYLFIRYPRILAGFPNFQTGLNAHNPPLSEEMSLVLEQINEKKLYLDTELNEHKLAQKLDIRPYLLSKFLNDELGKSFSQFIKEKRIEEAKKLLQKSENQNLTIFSIAIDSGFKSESSFYANFKEATGMTPNQYKKQFLNY